MHVWKCKKEGMDSKTQSCRHRKSQGVNVSCVWRQPYARYNSARSLQVTISHIHSWRSVGHLAIKAFITSDWPFIRGNRKWPCFWCSPVSQLLDASLRTRSSELLWRNWRAYSWCDCELIAQFSNQLSGSQTQFLCTSCSWRWLMESEGLCVLRLKLMMFFVFFPKIKKRTIVEHAGNAYCECVWLFKGLAIK